jgi:CarD family transcriptional regulator
MLNRARRDTPATGKKALPRSAQAGQPAATARASVGGFEKTMVPELRERVIFRVDDMAVHPAHGVGQIVALEQRALGGKTTDCYILKMLDTGLTVMVPTEQVERVGLRPVMQHDQAQGILEILRAPEVAVDLQPWNRRFRAYTEMLRSGLPSEIAKVLRDMYRLKFDKDLSFGERRLLDQARGLLIHELALAKKVERSSIEVEIQEIFTA